MKDISPEAKKVLEKAMDLSALPIEEQEELLTELNDVAYETALLRIIEQMDDVSRDAFNALLETEPTEEQVMAFIEERVPNADEIIEATVDELQDDILAATGESQD